MPITYDENYNGYPIMTDEEAKQGCDTEILDRHIERTEDMTKRHNKVFCFRIDLGYRQMPDRDRKNKDISDTIAATRKYFKRHETDTSFSWRLEENDKCLPHGHVAVMVDGNKIMAPERIKNKLEENWKRQVGEDNARIHICKTGYRMRKDDPNFEQVKGDWIYRTSYLAKDRDRGNSPKGQHEHGGTRVKKK
ncbi:inovirus Gp2 family protein [Pseudodesulfovibrio portus]|uniref:YagK/YfjJ C-terminal domain-containing protein n=1 Tax=Pseudodesulfovibrio portus TaxID=231439 RepID=A0ABN6RRP0_9BACT|nr:inovirus Gp2 family protein [Pseudodesulfovibrio portus]BDQ32660.1 hypothetical protein JCM14722_02020 [Pseudodesulfovibrio portus]